jgi:hypothetical protein
MIPLWQHMTAEAILLSLAAIVTLLIDAWKNSDWP